MSSQATGDVAVPGDIHCMVLGQNVGQGQTKWDKQTIFLVLLFCFLLFLLKFAKFHNKAKKAGSNPSFLGTFASSLHNLHNLDRRQ